MHNELKEEYLRDYFRRLRHDTDTATAIMQAEEASFHIDELIAGYRELGYSPVQSTMYALKQFGDSGVVADALALELRSKRHSQFGRAMRLSFLSTWIVSSSLFILIDLILKVSSVTSHFAPVDDLAVGLVLTLTFGLVSLVMGPRHKYYSFACLTLLSAGMYKWFGPQMGGKSVVVLLVLIPLFFGGVLTFLTYRKLFDRFSRSTQTRKSG